LKQLNNQKDSHCDKDIKEGDKKELIGDISTLEYLVEKAFGFDKNKINKITSKIVELKPLIYKWRKIMGDGNCFYRAIMFSYIENLIFDRNIYLLRLICIEVNTIFNDSNPLMNKFSSELKKKYSKVERIFFDTMMLICDIVDLNEKKHIKKAYEVLFQVWNEYKEFDLIMIKYLRYKIYEYISQNKDKIVSKEFNSKVKDLIPEKYIKDDSYKFDEFYQQELLEIYKDAESITICIIPFVLKVDVTILPYDFENTNNNQNVFKCFLPDKHKIVLLLRKGHYDLIYSKEYFDKFYKYLTNYNELKNVKSILSTETLLSMENIERLTNFSNTQILNTLKKNVSRRQEKLETPSNKNSGEQKNFDIRSYNTTEETKNTDTPKSFSNEDRTEFDFKEYHSVQDKNSSLIKNKFNKVKHENKEFQDQIKEIKDNILTNLKRKTVNFEIFKNAYNHDMKKFQLSPLKQITEKLMMSCSKCGKSQICFTFYKQCKYCIEELIKINLMRRFKYFSTFSLDVLLNNLERSYSEILKKRCKTTL
jgi:hypothetical protein